MGTNRRYADKVTRQMANRAAEGVVTCDPLSLGSAELAPEVYPFTAGRVPVWVRTWVRYPDRALRAEAQAIAWTDQAVQVQWEAPAGGYGPPRYGPAVDRLARAPSPNGD